MDKHHINNKRGLFIAFEGPDGSGKTTQANMLTEYLLKRGLRCRHVREPGGTPVGDSIRKLLLDPDTVLTSLGEAFLYAAARAQLVQDVILPALEQGETVISDRYLFSSIAYQGYGLNLDVSLVTQINLEAVQNLLPDVTYFLDIEPDSGLLRQAANRGLDRIELRDGNFHRRVNEGYRKLAHAYRMVVLDGLESAHSIHGQIMTDISRLV